MSGFGLKNGMADLDEKFAIIISRVWVSKDIRSD